MNPDTQDEHIERRRNRVLSYVALADGDIEVPLLICDYVNAQWLHLSPHTLYTNESPQRFDHEVYTERPPMSFEAAHHNVSTGALACRSGALRVYQAELRAQLYAE
jgi:hypothetical protein